MTDSMIGWIAIGIAAGLVAMIWPFRRGVVGVVVNLVAGVAGATLVASATRLAMPGDRGHNAVAHLFSAAVGALAAISLVHLAWMWSLRRGHRRST